MDDSIYKEFMCFDRTLYYILKVSYNIDITELLFADRYMGFYRNKNRELINHIYGLEDFVFNKDIVKKVCISIDDVERYIKSEITPREFKVAVVANFVYPDKDRPFPYKSYMIIESFNNDTVNLTKLSNVEQKIKYNEEKNKFIEMINNEKGNAELYIFKDTSVLKDVQKRKKSETIKYIMVDLFGYNVNLLNRKFKKTISNKDIFIETANYHKERLNGYIRNGINRSEYSHFVRRLGQMMFPSFLCYDYMKLNGIINRNNIKFEDSRIDLQEEFSIAHKNILAFIWTKDLKFFDEYLFRMEGLNKKFRNYQNNFHKFILTQL